MFLHLWTFKTPIFHDIKKYKINIDGLTFFLLFDYLYKNYNIRKKFELMILQWKRFNEKMSKHPYSTLTTNELIKLGVVGDVNKILTLIDRVIYGNNPLVNFTENFKKLKNHSHKLYYNKLIEIKDE